MTESVMWQGSISARECDADTGPRTARLLSFGMSPKVYQSGVIVRRNGSLNWCGSYPPLLHRLVSARPLVILISAWPSTDIGCRDHIFDPEQGLALGLALMSPPLTQHTAEHAKIVVLGGGGGTLTMALHSLYGGKLQQDMVELDPNVITAAHEIFGLEKDHPSISVHCANGLDFLAAAESSSCVSLASYHFRLCCTRTYRFDGFVLGGFGDVMFTLPRPTLLSPDTTPSLSMSAPTTLSTEPHSKSQRLHLLTRLS